MHKPLALGLLLLPLGISPTAMASIHINEVVASAVDDGPDWIEFYNAGETAMSLDGYAFTDADDDQPHGSHLYTFPAGTTLAPQGFLVVEKGDDGFDFGFGGSDGAFLMDASGTIIDATLWEDGQNPEGQSWGRYPDGQGEFQTLSEATQGSANASPGGEAPGLSESDYIYDGTIRQYELIMTDEDWQWLQDNAQLEEYVPGYIVFEGETIGPVGIRFKGSYGSLYGCFDDQGNQTCDKLSMKISFHEYTDGGRFYGLKKLQFHALMNDVSKMHDELGYALFRENGVKAPRTTHSNLVINGENYGLYQTIEQIDSQFARFHYADGGEGNVYKEVWPEHFEEQVYIDALKTNEEEANVAGMVNFATDIAASTRRDFRNILPEYMDIDQLMRYWVVDRSINHWDGPNGWYSQPGYAYNHNYYWYEGVDGGKFTLIPWDLDFTFSDTSIWYDWIGVEWDPWYETPMVCTSNRVWLAFGLYPAGCDDLIGGIADYYWNDYVDALEEYQSSTFTEERIIARIDALESKLRPHIEADPFLDVAEWEADVQRLRDEIPQLRAKMAAEIAR